MGENLLQSDSLQKTLWNVLQPTHIVMRKLGCMSIKTELHIEIKNAI